MTTFRNIKLRAILSARVLICFVLLEAGVVGAVGDIEDRGHFPGGLCLHLLKQGLQVHALRGY